jgi:hypothetical protein
LSAVCGSVSLCLLAGCSGGSSGPVGGGARVEEVRVASPDGRYDALITRESIGGVLGGVYWNVFIVPKGASAAKEDDRNTILNAAVLRGEKLVWKQGHLLEIHYDMAHIEQFRNLWGSNELEGRGPREGDYLVEARLVPSSSDFSFLTPDGGFKPRD